MPPLMLWLVKPLYVWLAKVMPTFGIARGSELPGRILGQPSFHLVRVKPTRAELTREGEKVWTQLVPTIQVGNRLMPGKADGQHRRGAVIGRGHGIESRDLVVGARVVLDLDVALVVGFVAARRGLVVVVLRFHRWASALGSG